MLKSQLEAFLAKLIREINQTAENLMVEQMPVITEDLFGIFEKTGNRLQYENVYFTRRKFLTVLGLKAILEKQSGQYTDVIQKLAEVYYRFADSSNCGRKSSTVRISFGKMYHEN